MRKNFADYLAYAEVFIIDLFFYSAIVVNQQNDIISDENQLSADMDLFLRSQSQTKNFEATRNEIFSSK